MVPGTAFAIPVNRYSREFETSQPSSKFLRGLVLWLVGIACHGIAQTIIVVKEAGHPMRRQIQSAESPTPSKTIGFPDGPIDDRSL